MTIHELIRFVARVSERGPGNLSACRVVPAAALGKYANAVGSCCRTWRRMLADPDRMGKRPEGCKGPDRYLRSVYEEIQAGGLLIHVAGVTLAAIGERLPDRSWVDVAHRTVGMHRETRREAGESVKGRLEPFRTDPRERLAASWERLGDLLASVALAHGGRGCHLSDRSRARDFAATYGPRPGLVRLPVRSLLSQVDNRSLAAGPWLAETAESLEACLPGLVDQPDRGPTVLEDLEGIFRPRILRLPDSDQDRESLSAPSIPPAGGLSFPTLSFSGLLRRRGR